MRALIQVKRVVLSNLLILGLIACTPSQPKSEGGGGPGAAPPPSISAVPPASVDRGRVVYATQCAICHNADPKKAGPIGPEVFGASKELLVKRILEGKYPEGYRPKRETHTMVALPHLKHEIDSLHLFLNSPGSP